MESFTQRILNDDLINSVYKKNDLRFWKCYFAKWERIYEGGCNALLKRNPLEISSDGKHVGTIMQVTQLHYGIKKIYTVLAHEEYDAHHSNKKYEDEEIIEILRAARNLSSEWFSDFNEIYFEDFGSLPTEKTFDESFINFLNEFKK